MTGRAAPAPSCIAIDTDTPLTWQLVRDLSTCTYRGEPVRGICRYVSLGQPNFKTDISAAELAAIINPANDLSPGGRGLGCWLVQHVPYGLGTRQAPQGWAPNAQLGSLHGLAAKRHASLVGYPATCSLGEDLEGVSPSAPHADVTAHCDAWARSVALIEADSSAYAPLLYDGYSPGLTAAEMWELPDFHAYWGTRGSPAIPKRGYQVEQLELDVVMAGVKVDVNRITPDALGGTLIWCVALDSDRETQPDLTGAT